MQQNLTFGKIRSKSIVSKDISCFFLRDDEMDGVWEVPIIQNPLCEKGPGCGKWSPPIIPNPAYKGPWSAPLIDNPKYRVGQFF